MPIPGDKSEETLLDRILRVNHAGEYGAQRIYEGQLAVLGKDECAPMLRHMAEQEKIHLQKFEELMVARRARPTALWPLWHVAGFALGAGTAMLGKRAAMACTVAVESVIAEHYQSQLDQLGENESELKNTIAQFRDEEIEHHAIGIEQEAEQAPFYELLSGAIRTGCHMAIWLAKRV
jgi:ubiquinone biosynthesis monooxygenase Coq7